jgi:peptide/nickel transport system substrate-binding protein
MGVPKGMAPTVRGWRGRGRSGHGRWTTSAALLLVLAMVAAACGADDPEPPTTAPAGDETEQEPEDPDEAVEPTPTGDTEELRIRQVSDVGSLDPAWLDGTTEDAILMTVMEGLVTFQPGTTDVVNQLAETFESSDDGLRHDFTLREGIQFHGGYGELTAEDVKFSFERIAGLTDPPLGSTYAGDWETLQEVEVTGTYSGTIVLSEPFAPLMVTTLPGNAGLIVSKAAFDDLGDEAMAANPIGTGPYEFVSSTPGSETIVQRFADYGGAADGFAERPQWERIVFVPIEDDNAADIALETGDVDFGTISAAAVDRFADDDRFVVEELTTFDYGWVGMNPTNEALSDVNVRRAIRQALDVDSMITAGFEDRVTRAHALISPEMPVGHWSNAPVYDQDLDAAREHLAEAGIDDLSLTMTINEQPGSRTIAEITQANLAEIGITVDIELVDGSEMLESARAGTIQLFYFSFSNSADPSWATVWFTCGQVGDWNFMSWCNEDFDALHEAALIEQDDAARTEMYVEMQEIMDEDAVAAWVMYRTNFYAHTADLSPSLIPARYGKFAAWDFRR